MDPHREDIESEICELPLFYRLQITVKLLECLLYYRVLRSTPGWLIVTNAALTGLYLIALRPVSNPMAIPVVFGSSTATLVFVYSVSDVLTGLLAKGKREGR